VVCLRLGAAARRVHAAAQAVHPGATGTSGVGDHRPDAEVGAGLAELAYGLLDAHMAKHSPWADRACALRRGRVVLERSSAELVDDLGALERIYLRA
jgi:hypothetical protein